MIDRYCPFSSVGLSPRSMHLCTRVTVTMASKHLVDRSGHRKLRVRSREGRTTRMKREVQSRRLAGLNGPIAPRAN